jgi:hypothetical protein
MEFEKNPREIARSCMSAVQREQRAKSRLCVTQRALGAKNRLLCDFCGLLFIWFSQERMVARIAADERVTVESGSQKFSEANSPLDSAYDSALYRANDLWR